MKKTLVLAVVSAALVLVACGGSGPATLPSTAAKGGTDKSASAAKSSGVKAGSTAAANTSAATNKGAKLGGASTAKSVPATATTGGTATTASAAQSAGVQKGATASANKQAAAKGVPAGAATGGTGKTAADAQAAGQTSGSTALGNTTAAEERGPTLDAFACDAGAEGVGYCADATHVFFCASGSWWWLDCSALLVDGVCAEIGTTVDCYAELAQDVPCSDFTQGLGFCAGESELVFCDANTWYALDCAAIDPGNVCADDGATVDCYATESSGLVCDASIDGLGYCADDANLIFCNAGEWYQLDCSSVEGADVCAQVGTSVDCYGLD